jgi:membrane protein implicated in regulation of membrane protease activity
MKTSTHWMKQPKYWVLLGAALIATYLLGPIVVLAVLGLGYLLRAAYRRWVASNPLHQ